MVEITPYNQLMIHECNVNIESKIKWMLLNAILAGLNYGVGFSALIKGTNNALGSILIYGNIGVAIILTILYCYCVIGLYENLTLKEEIIKRSERGS